MIVRILSILLAAHVITSASPGPQGIPEYQEYATSHTNQKDKVSESDFKAVIASLHETDIRWTTFQFKQLYYVGRLPGGLTTNSIFVTLEEVRSNDLMRGVIFVYDRKNGMWSRSREQRTLKHAVLSDDVSYEQGEQIVRLIRDNSGLINGHYVSAIKTLADEPFKEGAPQGTRYIVSLSALSFTTTHNTRFVYIALENATFQIIGKRDSMVIH